jgi:hypothetical protein
MSNGRIFAVSYASVWLVLEALLTLGDISTFAADKLVLMHFGVALLSAFVGAASVAICGK